MSKKPGEVFHTDVCGPMSVETSDGASYFLLFVDDATGYCYVYFLRYKSNVFEKFKIFEKLIANKFGRPMKILRSDREAVMPDGGGEKIPPHSARHTVYGSRGNHTRRPHLLTSSPSPRGGAALLSTPPYPPYTN